MANDYYTRINSYPRFSTARGDAVQAEFDAVQAGFDRLGTQIGSGTIPLEGIVRYTAGDLGAQTIGATAPQRANTVQGFDSNGDPVLVDGSTLGTAASTTQTVRATFAAHGIPALPAHGFWPLHADASGPALASNGAFTTMKTAFAVGRPNTNTLDLQTTGFLEIATGHGLTRGLIYYLSTGGQITPTRPTTGNFQRVCEVWSATLLLLFNEQPFSLG